MVRGLLVVLLALCAAPAMAQTAPDTDQGRFTFHKVDEGFLRLDSRSGQVSLCAHKSLGWACETIPDERAALESEIARLQTGNAALKKELLARGLKLPDPVRPEPPLAKGETDLKLPSQADVDRVMAFMEKVWKRMIETAQNLQKDFQNKL